MEKYRVWCQAKTEEKKQELLVSALAAWKSVLVLMVQRYFLLKLMTHCVV